MSIEIPGAGGKAVLICNTGGHLTELLRIEKRMGLNPDSIWVTFDTMQSRDLLAGRRVHHLPYTGPRDVKGTLRAAPVIRRLLRQERPDAAISTGAAIAVAALPVAAMIGIPSTYIESVTRLHGPSTTGRLLQLMPGVGLRTQHSAWSSPRWKVYPSILGDYRSEPVSRRTDQLKIFVTLGTIRGYRFDSVVDAFLRTGLANSDTVWQLGHTARADALPGSVFDHLSPAEFAAAARDADVVITHAGAGTLLELLDMGIYPVQAVRRAARREHVDDHQAEIAELVNSMDLGLAVDGPDLTADLILQASQRRVVDATRVPEVRS